MQIVAIGLLSSSNLSSLTVSPFDASKSSLFLSRRHLLPMRTILPSLVAVANSLRRMLSRLVSIQFHGVKVLCYYLGAIKVACYGLDEGSSVKGHTLDTACSYGSKGLPERIKGSLGLSLSTEYWIPGF
jgi:hypothetical protein